MKRGNTELRAANSPEKSKISSRKIKKLDTGWMKREERRKLQMESMPPWHEIVDHVSPTEGFCVDHRITTRVKSFI
jgi:hypothetical protein